MAQHFFNTLTKKKELFSPIQPGHVGMYVCGVTVYDYCHIGHARVYVAFDLLYRWLKQNYHVKYVRNFTDVDDKIIKRANENGENPIDLASRFIDAFHEDMGKLNILPVDVEPRVSTHMQEIIDFVQDLVVKGFAYRAPSSSTAEGAGDDVYFRVRLAKDYTALSGHNLEDLAENAGKRIDVDERKEDPLDFALWKSAKPDEIYWESPFGRGRPGWHIECSAMGEKHLGETFDIHCGGRDLVFPHHTNEIAQSCARHDGKPLANYWMHNGFVSVAVDDDVTSDDDTCESITLDDGSVIRVQKMSKSKGNFFRLRDLLEQYTPESLRWLLISTHYRSPIAYSPKLLDEAERRVQAIYETRVRIDEYLTANAPDTGAALSTVFANFMPWEKFAEALSDDVNTPEATAALGEVLRIANSLVAGREVEIIKQKLKPPARARLLSELKAILLRMTDVLGVGGAADPKAFLLAQRQLRLAQRGLPESQIQMLLDKRQEARQSKNFAAADAVRADLLKLGIEVRDTSNGVEWNVA